jgi:hypothetical protein
MREIGNYERILSSTEIGYNIYFRRNSGCWKAD